MEEPRILYNDKDMLVVIKPAGMIVNRADTSKGNITLQDWVDERYQISNFRAREKRAERHIKYPISNEYIVDGYNKLDEFISRSGIVHRLDKETSGIILVALTPESFMNLQGQFKNGTVKKTYTALLHGKLMPEDGEINAPIGRLPWNRMRFGVLSEGRPAQTLYKVLEYKNSRNAKEKETFTLVEVYPQTGRTHQIRVHFQHVGHPIVADVLYAGRKTGRSDRQRLPRHFLHASKISFQHPRTLVSLVFSAPLPEDLDAFLKSLQKIS